MAISKDSFIKSAPAMPASTMDVAANSFRPSSDFLSFYSVITKFFADMKIAFEDENFERMVAYNIEIAKTVIKRLEDENLIVVKNDTSTGLDEKIAKEILSKKGIIEKNILDILSKNNTKSKTLEDKKEDLIKQIDKFKDDLLDLITEKFRTKKKREPIKVKALSEEEKEKNRRQLAINQELAYQNSFFVKEITKIFTAPIIKPLQFISNGTDRLYKNTVANFRTLHLNLLTTAKRINEDFKKSALLGITSIGTTIAKITKKTLAKTIKLSISFLSFALKTAMTLRSVMKIVSFWGGLLLKPLKFVFSQASALIRLGFSVVRSFVGTVYNLGAGIFHLAGSAINMTFDLAKKVFKTIHGFSILNVLKTSIMGFFSTYPGAYALGYLAGTVWGMILRFAGVSNEDYENGNYSALDVLLLSFRKVNEKIVEIFTKVKDSVSAKAEVYSEQFKASSIGKVLIGFFDVVKGVGNIAKDSIPTLIAAASSLYEVAKPLAEAVKHLVRFFTGVEEFSLTDIRNINLGAYAGLGYLKRFKSFRGGLAGLLTVALTLGGSAISKLFGSAAGAQTQENAEKAAKYPMFVNVNKKTASLVYNQHYDNANEPKTNLFGMRTTAGIKYDYMKGLYSELDSAKTDEEREAIKARINEASKAFNILRDEYDEIDNIQSGFSRMMEIYYENLGDGTTNYDFKRVSLINDILYSRGKPIIDKRQFFNIFPGGDNAANEQMFAFLAMIINARIDLFNKEQNEFITALGQKDNTLSEFRKLLADRDYLEIEQFGITEKSRDNKGVITYNAPVISLKRAQEYSANLLGKEDRVIKMAKVAARSKDAADFAENIGTRIATAKEGKRVALPPGRDGQQRFFTIKSNGRVEYEYGYDARNKMTKSFDNVNDFRAYVLNDSLYVDTSPTHTSSRNFDTDIQIPKIVGKVTDVHANIVRFIDQIRDISEQFQNNFLDGVFSISNLNKSGIQQNVANILTRFRNEEIKRLTESSYFDANYKDMDDIHEIAANVFKRTLIAAKEELYSQRETPYEKLNEILYNENKLSEKTESEIKSITENLTEKNRAYKQEFQTLLNNFRNLIDNNTKDKNSNSDNK